MILQWCGSAVVSFANRTCLWCLVLIGWVWRVPERVGLGFVLGLCGGVWVSKFGVGEV